jgi:tetratricopeptide (TPR) repeat protein
MIAAGLWVVIPEELKNLESESSYKPLDNVITRNPKAAYAAIFLVFAAFFTGFFVMYKNMHLSDRAKYNYIENIMSSGKDFASSGMYERAVEEFKKAAVLDPQNPEAYYQLAVIYDFNYFDPVKALYNFKECLRLNPHHLDRARIENEISRLEYQLKK